MFDIYIGLVFLILFSLFVGFSFDNGLFFCLCISILFGTTCYLL